MVKYVITTFVVLRIMENLVMVKWWGWTCRRIRLWNLDACTFRCLIHERKVRRVYHIGSSVHASSDSHLFFYFVDRVDPGDRGPEYRSLIGLPGGVNHDKYQALQSVAAEAGFKLEEGKGNDPDTFGKQLVYVYDTAKYPFYQAEVYHQFHDDFQSRPYGRKYNALADAAFDDGRLCVTGCPDRV